MQWEGRYHALAKDEQCFLRCERLELPMSQMGHRTNPLTRERAARETIQRERSVAEGTV
jgi:hypothetical protein